MEPILASCKNRNGYSRNEILICCEKNTPRRGVATLCNCVVIIVSLETQQHTNLTIETINLGRGGACVSIQALLDRETRAGEVDVLFHSFKIGACSYE